MVPHEKRLFAECFWVYSSNPLNRRRIEVTWLELTWTFFTPSQLDTPSVPEVTWLELTWTQVSSRWLGRSTEPLKSPRTPVVPLFEATRDLIWLLWNIGTEIVYRFTIDNNSTAWRNLWIEAQLFLNSSPLQNSPSVTRWLEHISTRQKFLSSQITSIRLLFRG